MSVTPGDTQAGRWGDLKSRALSAVVMLSLGIGAIVKGGVLFAALAVVVTGLMIWELASMTAPARRSVSVALGVLASLALASVLLLHSPFALIALVMVPLAGAAMPRRDRVLFGLYGLAIMLSGYGLVALREGVGLAMIVWLVAVVVVSDIAGYFAGKTFGGPKFWPAISPKKTWSGTVAGWFGAALVGAVFWLSGFGWMFVLLSPFVAFAGQIGDIVESWLKRRAGVKDSSSLIPGHGGVLDRFDALVGAVVLLLVLGLVMRLPLVGG